MCSLQGCEGALEPQRVNHGWLTFATESPTKMPEQQRVNKQQAAREVVDVLNEISTLLASPPLRKACEPTNGLHSILD